MLPREVSMADPPDFYGAALRAAYASGSARPELTAALMATVAEAWSAALETLSDEARRRAAAAVGRLLCSHPGGRFS